MQVVDRRQFIIMKEPYIREDFRHIILTNGLILSYQNDLHVLANEKKGIYLLGWAFGINSNDIILDENCIDNKRYWAGRWILIYKSKIYLDCCGTLGCFYYNNHNKVIISSSLHLISKVLKLEREDVYEVRYGDGHGTFDYYPAPFTVYSDVFKVLPSQYIEFSDTLIKLNVNKKYMYRKYVAMSKNEIERKVIDGLACEMQNIEHQFRNNIWLSLTGGVDSRTNVAVAFYSGIKFHTYTVIRDNTNNNDLVLPKKICKKIGRKNLFLSDIQETASSRKIIYNEHTAGCSVGTERKQFLAGIDVPNPTESIVLWGTVWESYIKYYYQYFEKGKTLDERIENINSFCDAIITKSYVHKKSLAKWLKYIEKNFSEEVDWRERLYFEQRVGSWGSYSAQGLDLLDSVRIAPINCQELLELLLSLDVSVADKSIQYSIINKCCPRISKIRYGERKDIIYRFYRKIKGILLKKRS